MDQPTFYQGEMSAGYSHQPVLVEGVVENLCVKLGGVYIDCTVGEGGHASAILSSSMPGGQLLGIDLDPQALKRAEQRLRRYDGAYKLAHGSYADLAQLAGDLGFPDPDGIFFDLGLSSLQLEAEGRGFSFRRNEPLDMRFNPEASITAAEIINGYSFDKLVEIISSFGEQPRARSIARSIVDSRPIQTTKELADLVLRVMGGRRGKTHPATRTFQALRIAVNGELENLETGLQQAIALLKPGGRIVVLSYHSLEDRIVKQTLAREAKSCLCPPEIPVCVCGHTASVRVITRKVVKPSEAEVRGNPRSRSARMRAAQRL